MLEEGSWFLWQPLYWSSALIPSAKSQLSLYQDLRSLLWESYCSKKSDKNGGWQVNWGSPLFYYKRKTMFTSICVSLNWLAAGWWSRLVVVLKFLVHYGRRILETNLTKERRLCIATSVLKSLLGIKGKSISTWLLHRFRSGKLEVFWIKSLSYIIFYLLYSLFHSANIRSQWFWLTILKMGLSGAEIETRM